MAGADDPRRTFLASFVAPLHQASDTLRRLAKERDDLRQECDGLRAAHSNAELRSRAEQARLARARDAAEVARLHLRTQAQHATQEVARLHKENAALRSRVNYYEQGLDQLTLMSNGVQRGVRTFVLQRPATPTRVPGPRRLPRVRFVLGGGSAQQDQEAARESESDVNVQEIVQEEEQAQDLGHPSGSSNEGENATAEAGADEREHGAPEEPTDGFAGPALEEIEAERPKPKPMKRRSWSWSNYHKRRNNTEAPGRHTAEVVGLREEYIGLHGHGPMGRCASDAKWLRKKIEEKRAGRPTSEPTDTTKAAPDAWLAGVGTGDEVHAADRGSWYEADVLKS